MNSLPKLLITGASGFTGKHACHHFSNAGFEVIAVARNTTFNNYFQTEYCDLTNKEDVKKLVRKVKPQHLLHLAGQNHVGQSWADPISSIETNVMSTLHLIEALRHENPHCKVIVVGSALQFNPNQISTLMHPYSLSKTLQVVIAQSWEVLYNMPIVIAKPTNLIGPGFSNGVCSIFAKRIVNMEMNKVEKIIQVNNLDAERDFLDVRDAVKAYELILIKGSSGEIYDISSGKSYSLREIINSLKSLTAIDFKINSQANDLKEEKVKNNPIKVLNLGWKPTIPLEISLEDTLNFYRRNNG
ncbi:NAD-dependent epimerase/dehydratase family protein [Priestia megaterium]|jgi:GDP-4-dehydro-6-deoxy-D-mannose reductase|uniref:NAD-dependent epimerase/dehydratase family protein n=1 Tax=Priestia megaterium TaxID=1404 RepID=UPI002079C456|nr:NAD-dependent epimerase/dehydratase family protein [Priestia megaterium]USL27637.1 NAD-dependent epimerase/dehydratase family protein [Priestia megaterium]USL33578.1 NAD-dependent epimerase/dehydratase family protein [Priestia megaterium]WDM31647.1 NAD-dependent epimerase/dehydratase family protein [Priestia megaterium]